jgi:ectoine hydroxylase-related dioxygenase (phytanoyl-CoA dioxygenase family)
MQQFDPNVQQFNEEGYTIFRNVLDEDLVKEARKHIDWLLEHNPGIRPEQLHHTLMTDDPFWVRLVSDERLLDIAEAFIGPNIALFASHYIAKRPRDGQAVLWHQDGSYWPLEPMEVVTLWLAIDRSDTDNGCMRVLPGTQHTELIKEEDMEEMDDGSNVLGTGIRSDELPVDTMVDIVLDPGDVSVHHPNIIHGSEGNQSERWRRGLTIRYIPATTKILKEDPEPWPSAFLLRGNAVSDVNQYRPLPVYREGVHMPFGDAARWNEKVTT